MQVQDIYSPQEEIIISGINNIKAFFQVAQKGLSTWAVVFYGSVVNETGHALD
jgi:hypothetical protein